MDAQGRRADYNCRRSNVILWGNPSKGSTWHIHMSHSFVPGLETLAAGSHGVHRSWLGEIG